MLAILVYVAYSRSLLPCMNQRLRLSPMILHYFLHFKCTFLPAYTEGWNKNMIHDKTNATYLLGSEPKSEVACLSRY